eukprot:TRINITY_DN5857_c0_g1_i2.p1 TRINITY_DN5857_c0_g1~~TRINITY_DN5857_c0_g1_i2.p1  ORF type:complete len:445 (+),score=82.15 TRINITY_DN5857_c0_g1_i2:156-1490(+)
MTRLANLKRRLGTLVALPISDSIRWCVGMLCVKFTSPEARQARDYILLFTLCTMFYLYVYCHKAPSQIDVSGLQARYFPPGAAQYWEKKNREEEEKGLFAVPPSQNNTTNQTSSNRSSAITRTFTIDKPMAPPTPPPTPCAQFANQSTVKQLQKPFIFMHVPKSAGTTLAWPVRCMYGDEYQQLLLSASEENLSKKCRALIGHVKFGTHDLFPEKDNSTYLVWFRDPIERTISHYYYHYYSPSDRYHKVAIQNTLGNWVNNLTDANNLYTQFISGMYGVPPNDEAFELAKKNLAEKFKFVGLISRWNETLVMLKEYLGWPALVMPRPTKVNRRKPDIIHHPEIIDEETMKNITAVNHYDIQLFEIAKQRFEEQIQQMGKDYFDCEVNALRRQTMADQRSMWRYCTYRRPVPPVTAARKPPPAIVRRPTGNPPPTKDLKEEPRLL